MTIFVYGSRIVIRWIPTIFKLINPFQFGTSGNPIAASTTEIFDATNVAIAVSVPDAALFDVVECNVSKFLLCFYHLPVTVGRIQTNETNFDCCSSLAIAVGIGNGQWQSNCVACYPWDGV